MTLEAFINDALTKSEFDGCYNETLGCMCADGIDILECPSDQRYCKMGIQVNKTCHCEEIRILPIEQKDDRG